MMYERNGRQLLGSCLPQTLEIDKIYSKDEKLKLKLTLLLELITIKVNIDHDWTKDDYVKFRSKLANMETEIFTNTFDEMLFFLLLSKKELENKLRDLDQKLNTHIFDSERIIETVIDPKTDKPIQRYSFVPHCFNVRDLIEFLNKLTSVVHKYDNVLINHYNNKLKATGTIDEEQEKIKLLLEMLENREVEIIDIITKQYQEWVGESSTDEIIGSFLNRMFESVIEGNKKQLKQEIQKLEIRKMLPYYKHYAQAKRDYFNYQVKSNIKHQQIKPPR